MLDLQRFDMGPDPYMMENGQNNIVIGEIPRRILERDGYLIERIAYGRNKSNNALISLERRHGLLHIGKEVLAHYAAFNYYVAQDNSFAAFHEWNSSRPYTVSVIVKDNATFKKLQAEIKEDLTK